MDKVIIRGKVCDYEKMCVTGIKLGDQHCSILFEGNLDECRSFAADPFLTSFVREPHICFDNGIIHQFIL